LGSSRDRGTTVHPESCDAGQPEAASAGSAHPVGDMRRLSARGTAPVANDIK